VFSRRFVKSFPSFSREFEIETELTVHAMQMKMPVSEVDTNYKERPPGSTSKLRTFRDGWRILVTIMNLMRNERPLLFFSLIGLVLATFAVILGIPVITTYAHTGLVPRLPTAILCTGLILMAFISIATGLILDLVSHVRREAKRLAYLEYPSPRASRRSAPVA
jgi:hypothetical protein